MAALAPSSTSLSFLKTSRLMFLSTVATAAPTIPFSKHEQGFVYDIENRFQANILLSAECQQQIWHQKSSDIFLQIAKNCGRISPQPMEMADSIRIPCEHMTSHEVQRSRPEQQKLIVKINIWNNEWSPTDNSNGQCWTRRSPRPAPTMRTPHRRNSPQTRRAGGGNQH
jgi:hypothetical protein